MRLHEPNYHHFHVAFYPRRLDRNFRPVLPDTPLLLKFISVILSEGEFISLAKIIELMGINFQISDPKIILDAINALRELAIIESVQVDPVNEYRTIFKRLMTPEYFSKCFGFELLPIRKQGGSGLEFDPSDPRVGQTFENHIPDQSNWATAGEIEGSPEQKRVSLSNIFSVMGYGSLKIHDNWMVIVSIAPEITAIVQRGDKYYILVYNRHNKKG